MNLKQCTALFFFYHLPMKNVQNIKCAKYVLVFDYMMLHTIFLCVSMCI